MDDVNTFRAIEDLAAEIGENVYIDIANWHLYLDNAQLHFMLAERIYPLLQDSSFTEDSVNTILQNIPIELGGGKVEIPLLNLLSKHSYTALIDTIEEYKRKM